MRARTRRRLRWSALVLVIAVLIVAGRLIGIDTYLQALQRWIWSFGHWGPVVYVLLYVAATLVLLPGTPLTILAALLFGALWGFVTMTAATTLAAAAGFLIARYLARRRVEQRLGGTDSFRRLRQMTERNQWIAIPFVRLMPVFPFALNNYALGLTRISFWRYLLWSELIFMPMNAVYVIGAGALYRAMIRGEVSWLLIGISAGAGILVLGLGILGKRLMREPVPSE